jgi:hypothetical protein
MLNVAHKVKSQSCSTQVPFYTENPARQAVHIP